MNWCMKTPRLKTLRPKIWRLVGWLLLGGALLGAVPALPATPSSPAETLDDDLDPGMKIAPVTPNPPSRPVPVTPAESASTANPLWAIPLARLSNIRERPIFSPSRRPPPPAVVGPPVIAAAAPPPSPRKPQRPELSLVGTIIGETEGIGIFVEQGTANVVRLKTGEKHQGWTLRAVRGREATLANSGTTAVLVLPAPGSDKSATAEAPAAPTRRVHH
jgi:hypothetical protein